MLSKIATWAVWTSFVVVITVFVYRHTDWISPATANVKESTRPLTAKAPVDRPGQEFSDDKLNSAREAYARGDDNRAVTLYKEYIEQHPKAADAHGELGNVYYMSGRLIDAADVYYDTANLLLNENKLADTDFLLPVIAEVKPLLATELEHKLRNARGALTPAPTQISAMAQTAPQSALTRY